MKEKFDIDAYINEAIDKAGTKVRRSGKVNEDITADYAFRDEDDFKETLRDYVYYLFESDTTFNRYDKYVEDFVWSDSCATVDAVKFESEAQWRITMNPKFAMLLLDARSAMLNGDTGYDADRDEWPTSYFRLFECAVLYSVALMLYKSTTRGSVSDYESYLVKMSKAPSLSFGEFKQSFGEKYKDVIDSLEEQLRKYSERF